MYLPPREEPSQARVIVNQNSSFLFIYSTESPRALPQLFISTSSHDSKPEAYLFTGSHLPMSSGGRACYILNVQPLTCPVVWWRVQNGMRRRYSGEYDAERIGRRFALSEKMHERIHIEYSMSACGCIHVFRQEFQTKGELYSIRKDFAKVGQELL